ncbi:MAG TPA: response regulator [Verrucomicrobiae bacterium]|nr:response regulator [Verrucomicrobiae bacterium]
MSDSATILVIDDQQESLVLLTEILYSAGYKVYAADSGGLALAAIDAVAPDLILLDMRMPGMDGLEVCRRLSAAQWISRIPVIFMSSAAEPDERVEALNLGAVDFVSKPLRREELLARVRTHLQLSRLRHRLEELAARRTEALTAAVERLQTEVTERRRAELALMESEQRFRNIAESAPIMICASGPDSLATYFNRAWLSFTGRRQEQEVGNGWTDGIHPEDRDRCLSAIAASFGARQSCKIEYRVRRADGEYRLLACSGAPHFNPDGTLAGYIASMVDITDIRRAQEEIFDRQKLESMRVLTAGMAHDFNNLLGTILMQTELAESEMHAGVRPAEQLDTIKSVATRASEIVRELMIYAGQEHSTRELVDFSNLLDEMVPVLRSSVSRQAALEVEIEPGLPRLWGNPTHLRRLVMNLVINGSQALGRDGGTIRVSMSRLPGPADGGRLKLEVSDTGCGMTEAERTRIFDPFFTTKSEGHGLGLAVVQGIVQSHGGTIQVMSAPGKGSTFEIMLPCASEDLGGRSSIAGVSK